MKYYPKPIRQWILTAPFPFRFLFAAYPELMSKVLGIVTRTLSTHLANQAGFKKKDAHTADSEKRLSLTSTGKILYELKTPYRNGTTHVIFEPVDFIAHWRLWCPSPVST